MSKPAEDDDRMRVLIIEDENRMRDVLTRAVAEMNFAVQAVRSGEEGLRHLDPHPDIVILDLNLPGISGMDFFRELREKSIESQVVVLTGFGDLDSAKEAIRLQVAEFLTKPCHLGELEQALDRVRRRIAEKRPPLAASIPWPADEEQTGPPKLEDIERQHILNALERNKGNRQATASELGISLRTLYYRLSEYEKQGFRVD